MDLVMFERKELKAFCANIVCRCGGSEFVLCLSCLSVSFLFFISLRKKPTVLQRLVH